jgi:TonB family protein
MEKRCLIASASTHAFLAGLVLVGSAFIIPRQNPPPTTPLQFVPEVFIKEALAGGGGNPNSSHVGAVQKGQTLLPPAPAPQPTPPKQETKVTPPPPTPAHEKADPPKPKPQKKSTPVDKPEPKPVKDKPVKDKPVKETSTKTSKTADVKATKKDPKDTPLDLTPVTRPNEQKRKAEERARAAEERERFEAEARQMREAAKQWAQTNEKLSELANRAADRLQRGFSGGTEVDVRGPGGPAYANYASFVQAVYDDAWELIRDLSSDDYITKVTVTIARDGHVLSAHVTKASGNQAMDKSVKKALEKVKVIAPFPEQMQETEKTFIINFNLQAKRLIG